MTSEEYPWNYTALQEWQVDYIGPLPTDQGHRCVFTGVDMATGLGFAWPVVDADYIIVTL